MKHANMIMLLVVLLAAGTDAYALITTGWTEYASNPVYAPGKAYYPTIIKDGDTYTMWSDSAAGVQMATSTNGTNWTTVGSVSGLTTPKHTLVEKIGGNYRMWYWPNLTYSINDIRTATSTDGLIWTSDQAITQVGTTVINNSGMHWNRGSYGVGDVIYNPAGSSTIVAPVDETSVWSNKFVMYYDGTTGGDESLGLAVSNDGVNWQGYNSGTLPVFVGTDQTGDWDVGYVSRATISKENDDSYHMWYSGGTNTMDQGIGYAFSTDGINWMRDSSNPIFHTSDGESWRSSRTYTPMVIGNEMWFTGKDASGNYTIGYAVPEPTAICLLTIGSLVMLRKKR